MISSGAIVAKGMRHWLTITLGVKVNAQNLPPRYVNVVKSYCFTVEPAALCAVILKVYLVEIFSLVFIIFGIM